MARNLSHNLKRIVAGLCAVLVVAGAVPAEFGGVKLFDTAIVTSAAEYNNVSAFNSASEADPVLKLTQNVSEIYITRADGTVDLNGHTVTNLFLQNKDPNKTVTVKNGTINNKIDGKTGYDADFAGKVVLENLTVKGNTWADGHTITIISGTYNTIQNSTNFSTSAKSVVNIEGGNFSNLLIGSKGEKYVISGGSFVKEPDESYISTGSYVQTCDVTVNGVHYSYAVETHAHDGITFTPWTSTNSLPSTAGDYVLTNDVTLSGEWKVPSGTTRLCLNGHKITAGKHFYIPTGYALEIYDDDNTGSIDALYRVGSMFWVNGGKLTINGGTINGNVSTAGIVDIAANATFTMNGGKITGRSTGRYDASVIRFTGSNGTFNMTGGEISGTTTRGGVTYFEKTDVSINISGSAKITDNKLESGKTQNLYLANGVKVKVAGAMSDEASIGVTMQTPGVFTNSTNTDYNVAGNFTSDNADYEVIKDSTSKQLKLGVHSHTFTYTADGDTITAECTGEGTCKITEGLTMTISASDATYDGAAHGAELSTGYNTTAFPGTYTIEYFKGETKLDGAPVDAGNYTAKVTVGDATASVDFTIAKKAITITADDKSSQYGSNIAELTYLVTSTGFIVSDDLGVKLNTTATSDSDVGEYEITVSWNGNPNFDATLENGKYTITKAPLEITASGYDAVYDGEAHSISVTYEGETDAKIYYGTEELTAENYETAGSTENPTYTNAGEYTVYFYIVSNNYEADPISGSKVVNIAKADAAVKTAPEAVSGLIANGEHQELVTAGETEDGKLVYAATTDKDKAPADDEYSETIPTATNEGAYYVWYKVIGDENHNDSEPASIEVTIADAKIDISEGTVTVNAADKAVTVTVDGKTAPASEYHIIYFTYEKTADGESLKRVGTEFPTEPGTYIAAVVANEDSETYIGENRSEPFTITAPEPAKDTEPSDTPPQTGAAAGMGALAVAAAAVIATKKRK